MDHYFPMGRYLLLAVVLLGLVTSPTVARETELEGSGDSGVPGDSLNQQHTGNGSSDQVPFGADSISDTSEYALGSYTYNIIFLQDDHLRDLDDREHPKMSAVDCETINCGPVHWTENMLDTRKARILEASSWWNEQSLNRHHPAAQLEITVNFTNDVHNEGNPFTVDDIGDEGSSVGFIDALSLIDSDYSDHTSYSTATKQFNDDTRRSENSHWAVTTFVKPYYGRASASMNGPYTRGYEDDPSWTYLHELGHVFGARDEYGSASTSSRSGYLYGYNTNAATLPDGSDNPDSVSAVMKTHGNHFISDGSNTTIGWLDTDDDTIPDILDTFPTVTTDDSGSLPSTGFLQALIDATVTPLTSPDPYEGDFTINTLVSAQVRVAGGSWSDLPPIDSEFGDYVEAFQYEQYFSDPGTYQIDFRVANSVGNYTDKALHFTTVPEPSSTILFALIFVGIALAGRDQRSHH